MVKDFVFYIKYEHFTSVCRLCLGKEFDLIPIFPEEINFVSVNGDYDDKPINEMLEFCFKLKISSTDNLPKSICSSCLNLLKGYNGFYKKCLKTQEILENVANLHEMKLTNSRKGDTNVNAKNNLENDEYENSDKNYSDNDNNENFNDDNDSEPLSPNKTEDKKIKTKRKPKSQRKESEKKLKSIKVGKNPKSKENNENPQKRIKHRSGQCQICGKLYNDLRGHIRKIHSNRYKCTICSRTRPTLKGLEKHLNTHLSHKCEFCNESFASSRGLKDHRAAKHTKETNYSCVHCEAKFAVYDTYRKHLKTHSDNPVEYKCDICVKTFVSISGLNLHNRIHTGEKPYKCEDCGKSFCWSKNYRDHRRVHTKEHPYVCIHCGSAFTQKSSLNVHTKKFHPATNSS